MKIILAVIVIFLLICFCIYLKLQNDKLFNALNNLSFQKLNHNKQVEVSIEETKISQEKPVQSIDFQEKLVQSNEENSQEKLVRLASSAMSPLLTFIAIEPNGINNIKNMFNSTKITEVLDDNEECDLELQKQLQILEEINE